MNGQQSAQYPDIGGVITVNAGFEVTHVFIDNYSADYVTLQTSSIIGQGVLGTIPPYAARSIQIPPCRLFYVVYQGINSTVTGDLYNLIWANSPLVFTASQYGLAGNEFFKPMMLGPRGGVYQGTGTFASPQTGLKIWNSGGIGLIGGFNLGVPTWWTDTLGFLHAVGAFFTGVITLIAGASESIASGGGANNQSSVDWMDGANNRASVYASKDPIMGMVTRKPGGYGEIHHKIFDTTLARDVVRTSLYNDNVVPPYRRALKGTVFDGSFDVQAFLLECSQGATLTGRLYMGNQTSRYMGDDGVSTYFNGQTNSAVVDRSGQVFNPRAYGALVDGANDDTTAVQAAITANQA